MAFQPRRTNPLAYAGPVAMLFAVGFAGVWSQTAEERPPTAFRTAALGSSSSCHPSYSGECLPVVRDLDCRDVGGPVRVVGPDVYRLDRDHDGVGCELN